jgi:hypothetical protein
MTMVSRVDAYRRRHRWAGCCCDRLSDRIDDHASHLAAGPVTAAGLGPDRELNCAGRRT